MVRFTVSEYVRNTWYNVISVLIMVAAIVAGTIFISNITVQTKLYRLVKPYLNDNSIIISDASGFDFDTLDKVDKTLMTREHSCWADSLKNLNRCIVYDDEVMKCMPPRLDSGKYIHEVNDSSDEMLVLVTGNSKGLGVGDTFPLRFSTKNGDFIYVTARIVGVLSDGQKLFMSTGTITRNMGYEDLYCTYSYEQMEKSLIITTPEQMEKLGDELGRGFSLTCIVKFKDDITEQERNANIEAVKAFEEGIHGEGMNSISIYPETYKICDRMETSYNNLMIQYIPLTIAMFILISVCIMGIVTIKTANSMRYYATLHICGMTQGMAVRLTGIEMCINCIFAVIIGLSLITIQSKYNIVGIMNCVIELPQIIMIILMCVIIIVSSMLMTMMVMKEKQPADILKEAVF